jgi:hypothetical protein
MGLSWCAAWCIQMKVSGSSFVPERTVITMGPTGGVHFGAVGVPISNSVRDARDAVYAPVLYLSLQAKLTSTRQERISLYRPISPTKGQACDFRHE